MAEVFSTRTLMYWWAALSATVFLKDWLRNLTTFVQTTDMFLPNKIPFSAVPGLNALIDQAADYVRTGIQFNPEQELVSVGSVYLPAWVGALFFGVVLLALGVALYIRSLRTANWIDDLIALVGIFVLLRVEGHIAAMTKLPVQEQFHEFVNNLATAFVILLVLLLVLIFFGEGWHSRRAFWRALIESSVLAVFMLPHETALGLGYGVWALAQFGFGLAQYTPFAIAWGIMGIFLAVQRLAGHERIEIRRS